MTATQKLKLLLERAEKMNKKMEQLMLSYARLSKQMDDTLTKYREVIRTRES